MQSPAHGGGAASLPDSERPAGVADLKDDIRRTLRLRADAASGETSAPRPTVRWADFGPQVNLLDQLSARPRRIPWTVRLQHLKRDVRSFLGRVKRGVVRFVVGREKQTVVATQKVMRRLMSAVQHLEQIQKRHERHIDDSVDRFSETLRDHEQRLRALERIRTTAEPAAIDRAESDVRLNDYLPLLRSLPAGGRVLVLDSSEDLPSSMRDASVGAVVVIGGADRRAFEELARLLTETVRVLMPGGAAVVETSHQLSVRLLRALAVESGLTRVETIDAPRSHAVVGWKA